MVEYGRTTVFDVRNLNMRRPMFCFSVCVFSYKQESRAVARKPRDAAALLFGLMFADDIHYKFDSDDVASTKDPQFFRGFQIFCGSRSATPLPALLR